MIMRCFIILTVVWTVAASAFAADPVNGPKTALDEYVAKPDPTYEWKVVKTIPAVQAFPTVEQQKCPFAVKK